MKVYLAARYNTKPIIEHYASELKAEGIGCTSQWLEEPHAPEAVLSDTSEQTKIFYALRDLQNINEADWLVLFSIEPTVPFVRGGRHVEFGYALGTKKPILVVGPRENIFHYLPSIRRVSTWPEAVKFLKQVSAQQAVAMAA